MEVKEADKIVVAKPVPSRPTCTRFRSFSDLISRAIDSSPSTASPETAVNAIRPKIVRFKPIAKHVPVGMLSSHAELSGAAVCYLSDNENKVSNSQSKSTVTYRPLPKVVSKTTLCLLANLGNLNVSHQQALTKVEARVQLPNQFKYLHQNLPSHLEIEKKIEPSKMASENKEDGKKSLPHVNNGDRSSSDGYNWRKYGQKQVKGSEYPRSYYKCTHPNCPVKKKVERSLDGQIVEIVYREEHIHSKPQSLKCNREINDLSLSNQRNQRNEGCEDRTKKQNDSGSGLISHSTYTGKAVLSHDPVADRAGNTDIGYPEHSYGRSGDGEEGRKALKAEKIDKSRSNKRKNENELGLLEEGVQEAGIIMPSPVDSETKGDGFRWRKYGQKVVKGNTYPRSYYRCTSLKCNVRKHVERASDDPKAFLTTYEGRHNHDKPSKSANPAVPKPDSLAATSNDQ